MENCCLNIGLNGCYPFGMTQPGRSFNKNSYRFNFQGQETEQELWGGEASFFKYRISDNRLGRFFSNDPLTASFPWNSPYAFSENRVIDAIELEGLEAFLIHGTWSDSQRWYTGSGSNRKLNLGAKQLIRMSGNATSNANFNWPDLRHQTAMEKDIGINFGNFLFNNKKDRGKAANTLVKHIMKNMTGDEDITLIGHSHGGNVAIQSVPILRKALDDAGYSNIKINLITVSTPAENSIGDVENPLTFERFIDNHINLYNTIDDVQTKGATVFGLNGFDRTYDMEKTQNIEIDVSGSFSKFSGLGAHSWDVSDDELLDKSTDCTIPQMSK